MGQVTDTKNHVLQSHHQQVFFDVIDDGRLKRTGAVKNRERQIRNKKPRMVGREDDTEMLLDFLIEGEPLLSSIAIVAHGGYGKTTLAAQVYDNIYVMNYFDCRVWVDAF
ncbi:hypothetical protein LWI28_010579 [Acer negundo]|uniref:NB-ARC domain-containing protein n=1 Tax=Acer negundo TaxID=4023 RepID=A0AAD5J497_ACENE|nr:hypothetical protein LWI28_010579 [Acer negundo]